MTSSPDYEHVLLSEEDARRVILTRAVEEADLEGVLLESGVREEASQDAVSGGELDPSRILSQRALRLTRRLGHDHPIVGRLAGIELPSVSWIIAIAFVLGILSNLFGADRQIHVLANPLVVLVLWNFFVFGALCVVWILARRRKAASPASTASPAPEIQRPSKLVRLLTALPMKGLRRAIQASEGERSAAALMRAAARFVEDWLRVSSPLKSARLHRILHAGAMAMTLGALIGLYGRGLVLEYHAHWESTFLDRETGQVLIDVALAPASALSGIAVPRLTEIDSSTRAFLHLFSLTALLFVLIPRGILFYFASRHARTLARALPLDIGPLYYRRLLSNARGAGLGLDVFPYSFTLSPQRVDAVIGLLHDVFGGEANITVHDPLSWGFEAGELSSLPGTAKLGSLVILLNAAQTPERELQGKFLEEIGPLVTDGIVVLADCSAWRERVGSSPTFQDRLIEHRRAWEDLAQQVGVPIVHVDLDAEPQQSVLAEIEGALEGRVATRSSRAVAS